MDYLMGIDLGSTSLKAVIYDLCGNVIASGSRPTERFNPDPKHPEWTVWQPEQIWGGTAEAIHEAVAQLKDPRDVRAVAVTGMGMDGVPIDEDGKWLYPFISWHDARTTPQQEWWRRTIGPEKTFAIGGNPLWPIQSALRILWVGENEPEVMARTRTWLLIEDFVNFMLCGRRATDYSMASCTMLFDQRRLDWSHEMLELSGIDRIILPEALPSGTVLGEVSEEAAKATGLAAGTPVVLGGHDHLCGALPVGAFRPGVVLSVTGTWEFVEVVVSEPVLTERVRTTGATMQAHVARGMYSAWGSSVAGELLEWYRKQFGFEAAHKAKAEGGVDWDYLMAEASGAPAGSHGLMFLPHMSAAGCPIDDPRSLGAFAGLSTRATRGDILRAMIEGLDYQFLEIVEAMEAALDRKLETFVAIGGAVRNTFWMQNKADVIGRPIDVPGIEESTPLGAAILAGIGVGLYKDEQDAFDQVYKPGRTFEPDSELCKRYSEWYAIYKELYPATKPISHRLFEAFRA